MGTAVNEPGTYRTKADAIASGVRQVEINIRIQRVNGESVAAEFEGNIDLLVAWKLPHVTTELRAAYKLCAGNVFVECLRYRTALAHQDSILSEAVKITYDGTCGRE